MSTDPNIDEATALSGHVIVCGLRGVGRRIVEQLHRSETSVAVIDDGEDQLAAAALEGWGIPLVVRGTSVAQALATAGLATARAVICAEVDELQTLESALMVRELRADIRLVVQMANPSVAAALGRVGGDSSVLDVATLAGPTFVEACLRQNAHTITLAGTRFDVVEATVARAGTFRRIFGDLAPVAVMAGDQPLVACPGRDQPLERGDRVAVLGTVGELDDAGLADSRAAPRPRATVSVWVRLGRRVATLVEERYRALTIAAAGIVGLLVLATIVVRFCFSLPGGRGHLSSLSSAYFVVETVATVGYGDFSFAAQAPWLKVFAIALIIVGVAIVSTAFALFTNVLVTNRIERSLGRSEVTGMTDHVVVIGLGAVGISVVRGLVGEGQRVVVIERDEKNRYLDQARALGVPIVIADATQSQTHQMVHLGDAAAVAVLTSADLTNIETGLAVRESIGGRWDEVPVALRVFDRELARLMERSFGFRHVRSTSAIASPWFVGAALGLDVISTFYVDQEPFLVGKVTISPEGSLVGVAMEELSARTRVIALSRSSAPDGLEHPPRRGTRFATGDEAYLLGPYEELLWVLKRNGADGTVPSRTPDGMT